MSHVADGDLHAYLDGALEFYPPRQAKRIREHLERCPECRRRLDAEARVASEARAVLAEATPSTVAVPPLEELRRRADLVPPAVKKPARAASHQRWAWAATVVLALGIGWGVGAWPPGSNPPSPARSSLPPVGGQPTSEPQPGTAESRAASTEEERAPVLADSETARKSAPPPAEQVAAPPTAVEAARSENVARAADASTEERVVALDDVVILERQAPELPAQPLAGDASARLSDLVGASVASSATPPPAVTTADASRADAGAARRREQAPMDRPLVTESRVTSGSVGELRFSDPRAQAAGPFRGGLDRQQRAEEPAVRPPMTLPGLTVEVVEAGDLGPDPAVHVGQRTRDGVRVELYFVGVTSQVEADAAKSESPAPAAPARAQSGAATPAAEPRSPTVPPEHVANYRAPIGLEQVIVPFRDGWLIVHAPLARARLREMLQSAGVRLP